MPHRAVPKLPVLLVASVLCVTTACSPSAAPEAKPARAAGAPASESATAPTHDQAATPAIQTTGTPTAPATEEARDLRTLATLKHAKAQYREFLQRADGDPAFAEAVDRAKTRIADLNATIAFVEQGIAARRLEAEARP